MKTETSCKFLIDLLVQIRSEVVSLRGKSLLRTWQESGASLQQLRLLKLKSYENNFKVDIIMQTTSRHLLFSLFFFPFFKSFRKLD